MNVKNICFVCKQDGFPEREFKMGVQSIFCRSHILARAYLVRVKYDKNGNDLQVALCIRRKIGENQGILRDVNRLFKSMFGSHESLDIIFIDKKQELQLRDVCQPFFESIDYKF